MTLIPWDESYNLGIREIDEQHQSLVALINQLHDAMLAQKTRTVLGEIIQEMAKYTEFHFGTEERYFDEYGYPEALAHKREHDEFIQKVAEFSKNQELGKIMLSMDIINFLQDWLIDHIIGTDRHYAPFLKARGLH